MRGDYKRKMDEAKLKAAIEKEEALLEADAELLYESEIRLMKFIKAVEERLAKEEEAQNREMMQIERNLNSLMK